MLHSNAFGSMFSEVAEKHFKTRSHNDALCRNLKRYKMRHQFIIIECSGPKDIFKRYLCVVFYIIL